MRIILTLLSFFFLLSGCNQEKPIQHPPFSDQEVLDRGDVAIVYGKINNLQGAVSKERQPLFFVLNFS